MNNFAHRSFQIRTEEDKDQAKKSGLYKEHEKHHSLKRQDLKSFDELNFLPNLCSFSSLSASMTSLNSIDSNASSFPYSSVSDRGVSPTPSVESVRSCKNFTLKRSKAFMIPPGRSSVQFSPCVQDSDDDSVVVESCPGDVMNERESFHHDEGMTSSGSFRAPSPARTVVGVYSHDSSSDATPQQLQQQKRNRVISQAVFPHDQDRTLATPLLRLKRVKTTKQKCCGCNAIFNIRDDGYHQSKEDLCWFCSKKRQSAKLKMEKMEEMRKISEIRMMKKTLKSPPELRQMIQTKNLVNKLAELDEKCLQKKTTSDINFKNVTKEEEVKDTNKIFKDAKEEEVKDTNKIIKDAKEEEVKDTNKVIKDAKEEAVKDTNKVIKDAKEEEEVKNKKQEVIKDIKEGTVKEEVKNYHKISKNYKNKSVLNETSMNQLKYEVIDASTITFPDRPWTPRFEDHKSETVVRPASSLQITIPRIQDLCEKERPKSSLDRLEYGNERQVKVEMKKECYSSRQLQTCSNEKKIERNFKRTNATSEKSSTFSNLTGRSKNLLFEGHSTTKTRTVCSHQEAFDSRKISEPSKLVEKNSIDVNKQGQVFYTKEMPLRNNGRVVIISRKKTSTPVIIPTQDHESYKKEEYSKCRNISRGFQSDFLSSSHESQTKEKYGALKETLKNKSRVFNQDFEDKKETKTNQSNVTIHTNEIKNNSGKNQQIKTDVPAKQSTPPEKTVSKVNKQNDKKDEAFLKPQVEDRYQRKDAVTPPNIIQGEKGRIAVISRSKTPIQRNDVELLNDIVSNSSEHKKELTGSKPTTKIQNLRFDSGNHEKKLVHHQGTYTDSSFNDKKSSVNKISNQVLNDKNPKCKVVSDIEEKKVRDKIESLKIGPQHQKEPPNKIVKVINASKKDTKSLKSEYKPLVPDGRPKVPENKPKIVITRPPSIKDQINVDEATKENQSSHSTSYEEKKDLHENISRNQKNFDSKQDEKKISRPGLETLKIPPKIEKKTSKKMVIIKTVTSRLKIDQTTGKVTDDLKNPTQKSSANSQSNLQRPIPPNRVQSVNRFQERFKKTFNENNPTKLTSNLVKVENDVKKTAVFSTRHSQSRDFGYDERFTTDKQNRQRVQCDNQQTSPPNKQLTQISSNCGRGWNQAEPAKDHVTDETLSIDATKNVKGHVSHIHKPPSALVDDKGNRFAKPFVKFTHDLQSFNQSSTTTKKIEKTSEPARPYTARANHYEKNLITHRACTPDLSGKEEINKDGVSVRITRVKTPIPGQQRAKVVISNRRSQSSASGLLHQ